MPETAILCLNEKCTLRDKCVRSWSPPSRYPHIWRHIDQNEDETCDYFWSCEDKS